MGLRIVSGTGKANALGITDDNRAQVSSRSANRLYYVSRDDGKAFNLYGKANATSNSNFNLLYLQYTGEHRLFIQSMTFSSNSASAKIEVYKSPVYVSGGKLLATDDGVVNLNFTASNPLSVTAYNGDTALTMTTSGALELFDVRLNSSTFTYEFDGGLILGKGDAVGVLGSVVDYTVADRLRTVCYCYEA